MKNLILLVGILVSHQTSAQCPDGTVNLTNSGRFCVGDTLTLHASEPLDQILWYNGSQIVKVGRPTISASPVVIVAGGNGMGSAADQLNYPSQIYVDGNDNLFVADQDNERIEKYPPGSSGATNGVSVIPQGPTNAAGVFYLYSGLFLDKKGYIYVEETVDRGIQEWAPGATDGVIVATVSATFGYPRMYNLGKIFIDGADNIYVIESGNNRIQKWAPGANAGVTVAGGNGRGSAPNQLNDPTGVYVDNQGYIYVADLANSRIQKWAPGAAAGTTVAGGNGNGSAPNQLNGPSALCVDGAGDMYIADILNNRIQAWMPGAAEGITVAGGNGLGSALNQLNYPIDVFLDSKGYLYIDDCLNERILKCLPSLAYTIDTTLVANAPGTYTGVVTSQGGCTLTTNAIVIRPDLYPNLTISAFPNPACSGTPVLFTATFSNDNAGPLYHWQVNGVNAGADSSAYFNSNLNNGDNIRCLVSSENACGSDTSNSITESILASPSIDSGQVFAMRIGQPITLEPVLSGAITTYTWSPSAGLSDTTVRDPIADPSGSTAYLLRVVATDGCRDSAAISVKVFIPIQIPNAFTPNGDGRNDIFYVLGGPQGCLITDFAISNRWGQKIFQAHDCPPGDPAFGWDGRLGEDPAPAGTYVYQLVVRLANGTQQSFQGTVVLIR